MNYSIDILSDKKIVRVSIDGSLTQEERKEIHAKAINTLVLNCFNKLLIDVSNSKLSPQYSTGDSLDMIKYMARFESPDGTRIAYVNRTDEVPRKTFVETARQFAELNIQYFKSSEEAIVWLCDS